MERCARVMSDGDGGVTVLERLKAFEGKHPEIVFEWKDAETPARGWLVINSLRGGAAGGGTRMRAGLDRDEVVSLAKTMEVKFTVSGPATGGAKSGIDFDPRDPRRREVLDRWFRAVAPLLKTYYGTGGDLNVDELSDVVPATEPLGVWHPLEGVANGHYGGATGEDAHRVRRIGRLREGVSRVVADPRFTPSPERRYTVADLVTGWGVAESVRHHCALTGEDLAGKRVIVQGWGNVASAAGWFLADAGARIVGVIDRAGGVIRPDGMEREEVRELYLRKQGNALAADDLLPFDEVDARIWDTPADVFVPCAASRLVTREQIDRLVAAGVQVIASGANVPFADPEIFYGATYAYADERLAVIPDFIANAGMARVFAYLMEGTGPLTDEAIFGDVSATIGAALRDVHATGATRTRLAAAALEVALDKLG